MNFRVIDGHVHVTNMAPAWLKGMVAAGGADKYGVMALACGDQGAGNNLSALLCKAMDPQKAYAFFGLSYAPGCDLLQQMRAYLAAGFDGWKIIESKPTAAKATGVDLSAEAHEPLFALAEELQLPIMWHVGDPATFWDADKAPEFAKKAGWVYDETFPTLAQLYAQCEAVLQKHPKLKVALAHLYFTGDDIAHARAMLDTYPNLYLDITPGIEMYQQFAEDPAQWQAFFTQYADRILYGTDTAVPAKGPIAPYAYPAAVQAFLSTADDVDFGPCTLKGIALDEAVCRKIFADNYEVFAGAAPRAIDAAGTQQAIAVVMDQLKDANPFMQAIPRRWGEQVLQLL